MLDLDESAENQFRLFPNPAVERIHFSVSVRDITISDIAGRILQTIPEPTETLPVFELPKGVYFLRGTLETGETISVRFIRQEF